MNKELNENVDLSVVVKENPQILELMKKIFVQYPKVIIDQYKYNTQLSTSKQQSISLNIDKCRFNIEEYIEKKIVEVSGIMNIDVVNVDPETKGSDEVLINEGKGEVKSSNKNKPSKNKKGK